MIIDGRKLRNEILNEIKAGAEELPITLAIIQIGDDPASTVYIKQKAKMCKRLGFNFNHYKFNEQTKETEIITLIEELNQNETTGILLQLPIPKHFNKKMLQNCIDPQKDVDGLTTHNIGKLISGEETLLPCTAKAVVEILKRNEIEIAGQKVVVVGRSDLVGKPSANLLINEGATVTICHSQTKDLKAETITADILVVAVGKKHLITSDMVKKDVIIIDVGINKDNDKLYGDVDFEEIQNKASYITPVPGGVGPMTIAMLSQNIYIAYKIQKKDN